MDNFKKMDMKKTNLNWVLRLEGFFVFISAVVFYYQIMDGSWKLFLTLFLVPDLSLVGYVFGKRVGAILYNIAHSYVSPLVLWLFFYCLCNHLNFIPLIWIAHIGFDRALGFGLKYTAGFQYTHLGPINLFSK